MKIQEVIRRLRDMLGGIDDYEDCEEARKDRETLKFVIDKLNQEKEK